MIRTEIPPVHYPDSDGEPMADNTLQFDWIAILKWNVEAHYRRRDDVFVAGDHLIYPVEFDAETRLAPDAYVAFGPRKGYRGSYRVWEEGGIFPQVVFEVWSPNNRADQMQQKLKFYERYGAEEYYLIYPEFPSHLEAYLRSGDKLERVAEPNGFVSPRIGIRFLLERGQLTVYGPDGRQFKRPDEIAEERDEAEEWLARERTRAEQERVKAEQERVKAELEKQRADQEREKAALEKQRADHEKQRADRERQKAELEKQRAELLANKLRELGVDPDAK